jgi:hypothetical protein
MTDEELRRYVGRPVEVQFVDGQTDTGELVTDESQMVFGQPYALKNLRAGATVGVRAPVYRGIQHASVVRSIRVLEELPETEG